LTALKHVDATQHHFLSSVILATTRRHGSPTKRQTIAAEIANAAN
jgi:hypothetical protein